MTKTFRYGIALLSVVAAVAVRLGLDPILGPGEELLVFTLAVLLAARFGGRGPGVMATALSVLSAWFFFIDPRYSFALANLRDVGSLALLATTGAGISLLVGHPSQTSVPGTDDSRSHFNPPFFRRTVLLGGVLVLLGILTRLLYSDFEREENRQYWVTHTYEVLNESEVLTSIVEQAETAQRGYLLTGNQRYLQGFKSAVGAEQSSWLSLIRLTAGNPGQKAQLEALDRLLGARFASLQEAITLRQQAGANAVLARVHVGQGQRLMDQCRAALHAIQAEQRELLNNRSKAAEAQGLRTRWVLGLGSGSVLMLLIISGGVIERDIRQRDLARQATRSSEERLRMALDAANAGTWEWDLRTGENVWSDELWKVYGLEPHSCRPSYEAWRQIVHPDDRAEAERVVGEAARAGTELNVEFRVRDRDGGPRWLLARGQPVLEANGRPEYFVGIALDITHRKQAEESLQAREQNLRRFTEVAPVAIAMFDRDMRYLAASQRFRNDYQLGSQDLIGRSHYEVFPKMPEMWREIHRRCLAGEVERHPGERFPRSDGSEQWIRWEIQPWRDGNGEIGGIVLFSEDNTAQRRSEQAQRESEEQFRTLANAIPQLCAMANADGWIFWYNQRWYEYTGTTPKQMEGWGWQSVHDPGTLPKVVDRWKASIATGDRFEMVFPLRGADGAFHPFLTRIIPVRDGDGKVVRWVGTNTDITDQLATEAALRQASELRRLAIEAAELGAWDYHVHTGEVFWDERCRLIWGVDSGESFAYHKAIARIHPDDRPRIHDAVKQAIAGAREGAYHQEFRVTWPDGSVHWIASHGRVHFEGENGQRRPARFIGVDMDITERKQTEFEIRLLNTQLEQRVLQRTAELQTANKELEAFSYSVSHDLRAPLRGIDGWSLALAEDYADQFDERAQQYLGRVRSETQRMGLLIDDMLRLSRVSSTELRFVPVDLTDIAQSIAAGLAESCPGRHIEFVIEPGLTAAGDARLLEVALTNLLGNAVKFTGPRDVARIEFGLVPDQGERVFCVRDNGVGFDMTYAGTLFAAFQRLHKASEFPGTGIGLAIVQRVIHRHGGRVWAEARRDHGANFFFTVGKTT